MNVSFDRNDPLNANVLDGATGRLLFAISTAKSLQPTTTIRDTRGSVVAAYEWRWGHDRVTYHGQTQRASEWLPKKNILSSSRVFTAPNGRRYIWKKHSKNLQLVDSQSKVPVAESQRARHGLFSRNKPMGISLGPELLPFLDAVVLSFIICERERRKEADGGDGGDGDDGGDGGGGGDGGDGGGRGDGGGGGGGDGGGGGGGDGGGGGGC